MVDLTFTIVTWFTLVLTHFPMSEQTSRLLLAKGKFNQRGQMVKQNLFNTNSTSSVV